MVTVRVDVILPLGSRQFRKSNPSHPLGMDLSTAWARGGSLKWDKGALVRSTCTSTQQRNGDQAGRSLALALVFSSMF